MTLYYSNHCCPLLREIKKASSRTQCNQNVCDAAAHPDYYYVLYNDKCDLDLEHSFVDDSLLSDHCVQIFTKISRRSIK